MLKINKTKPYQFRKVHDNSSYAGRVVCILALICGIVSELMGLGYYNNTAQAARKTLSNITTMQEMTTEICNNSALGQSNTLTDIRDGKTYSVSRLSDGNCWMTSNLALDISKANSLSSDDTDIAEGTTWPETDVETPMETEDGTWTTDNGAILFAMHPIKLAGNDGAYRDEYGYYYTWCAATAGSCQVDGSGISDGFAESSICPKNWRLPTISEYDTLVGRGTSSWIDYGNANGYWIGGVNASAGGTFFPAAGSVSNDGLSYGGAYGYYWSSTPYINGSGAYRLHFRSDSTPSTGYNYRYFGRSIRCLAPTSSTDFPELFDKKDSNVAVMVAPVIAIDAVNGDMKLEADPNVVVTGEISATVSANTDYKVQLSAEKPDLTNPEDAEHKIPAEGNVKVGTNAWGIRNSATEEMYAAITMEPTVYPEIAVKTNEDMSRTHTFGIGVSIANTLPAGEYSTTVTITAVNN